MATPSRKIILLPITLGVLALGVYAYFFFIPSRESEPAPLKSAVSVVEKTREYRNTVRGVSLQYPDGLSVKEHDEGDGTYTIVFEDPSTSSGQTSSPEANEKSFQVFFTPYLGDTITQSRILKDVPSGRFTAPVEIVIGDGTRALAFFSTGPLGEMREVWFLHDGFLYEVTTYKPLDAWLRNIMQTWRFFPGRSQYYGGSTSISYMTSSDDIYS